MDRGHAGQAPVPASSYDIICLNVNLEGDKAHELRRPDIHPELQEILSHGVVGYGPEVRPRWQDGTPAHTVKLFGVVNRYDLRKNFPF